MNSALFKQSTGDLLLSAMFAISLTGIAAYAQPLGPKEIIQRAADVNGRDWATIHSLDYFMIKRDGERTKTFEVIMVEGSRYSGLVAVDGKPLAPEEAAKEQRAFETVVARRRRENKGEREHRIGQYEKEMKQYRVFVDEMIQAFDFTLVGQQMLGQYGAYVLEGKPRPSYNPPNKFAKALTGMQGTLWINTTDFHLLKAKAEVVSPVRIESFVAQIEPGTQIVLEQAPTSAGPWMPSHFRMYAAARVLLLFPHSKSDDNTYFDYHKPDTSPVGVNIVE